MDDDDDDDDDDLFADFDDDEQLQGGNISSNLLTDIGMVAEVSAAHQRDADDGPKFVEWTAPKFHGLNNSAAVADAGGTHWYRDEADEEMWNDLLDSDDDDEEEQTNVSANLLAPLGTVINIAETATPPDSFRSRRLSANLLPTAPKELLVAAQSELQPDASAMASAMVSPSAPSSGAGIPNVTSTPATGAVFPWWLSTPARDSPNTTTFAPAAGDDWFGQLQRKVFTDPTAA